MKLTVTQWTRFKGCWLMHYKDIKKDVKIMLWVLLMIYTWLKYKLGLSVSVSLGVCFMFLFSVFSLSTSGIVFYVYFWLLLNYFFYWSLLVHASAYMPFCMIECLTQTRKQREIQFAFKCRRSSLWTSGIRNLMFAPQLPYDWEVYAPNGFLLQCHIN